jgi:tRNA(fMet)-specific endonuclease VapC
VRLLLDTSAYSELRRGHSEIVGLVRRAQRLYLSSIVVGELLFGFRLGTRFAANSAELEDLLAQPRVELLAVSYTTADRFSLIAAGLRRKGRALSNNDIWIAAHAMETGAELVSLDDDFGHVDGLAWRQIV